MADDRDKSGRFTKGNKAGRGNPNWRRLAEHQAAVREAIEPGELRALLRKLYTDAMKGDAMAARTVLDRCLGRPREEPAPLVDLDVGELRDNEQVFAAARRVIRAAFAGEVPPDAARDLLSVLNVGSGDVIAEEHAQEVIAKAIHERKQLAEERAQAGPRDTPSEIARAIRFAYRRDGVSRHYPPSTEDVVRIVDEHLRPEREEAERRLAAERESARRDLNALLDGSRDMQYPNGSVVPRDSDYFRSYIADQRKRAGLDDE